MSHHPSNTLVDTPARNTRSRTTVDAASTSQQPQPQQQQQQQQQAIHHHNMKKEYHNYYNQVRTEYGKQIYYLKYMSMTKSHYVAIHKIYDEL